MDDPELTTHGTCGAARPVLVWRFLEPRLTASSAPVGGGLRTSSWILNAQVPLEYGRRDLEEHVRELRDELGCVSPGVAMLTAATIETPQRHEDGGVSCWATVGISKPTWAADSDGAVSPWKPGTINVVVDIPVVLSDAALLNAIVTATEAKSQALFERGVPGTGTASDAVCIVCPIDGRPEAFAGPRSPWGSRLARAVHTSVAKGLR
jgi:adenosylcobinamide hydrolase